MPNIIWRYDRSQHKKFGSLTRGQWCKKPPSQIWISLLFFVLPCLRSTLFGVHECRWGVHGRCRLVRKPLQTIEILLYTAKICNLWHRQTARFWIFCWNWNLKYLFLASSFFIRVVLRCQLEPQVIVILSRGPTSLTLSTLSLAQALNAELEVNMPWARIFLFTTSFSSSSLNVSCKWNLKYSRSKLF